MKWIYLTLAILSEVIATSSLKSSEGFTKLFPSLLVIAGYGLAFYLMSLTLKEMPVGIAYAVWSGIGVAFISLIGYFFYHQKLDMPAIIGIALIVCGVLVINIFSKTVSH